MEETSVNRDLIVTSPLHKNQRLFYMLHDDVCKFAEGFKRPYQKIAPKTANSVAEISMLAYEIEIRRFGIRQDFLQYRELVAERLSNWQEIVEKNPEQWAVVKERIPSTMQPDIIPKYRRWNEQVLKDIEKIQRDLDALRRRVDGVPELSEPMQG